MTLQRATALLAAAAATVLAAPVNAGERACGPTDFSAPVVYKEKGTVRFAQFNASLNRSSEGALIGDLTNPDNAQAQGIAEIIQRVRPDVILINEFDYDADGTAASLFQTNYLGVSQNGLDPIEYPYVFNAESNTGIFSGIDLNSDGSVGGPNDAYGFGFFPGQFGMLLLSKYPINESKIRTFQLFRWADMPGALLPDNAETAEPGDFYTEESLSVFRLSSKSHWDVPVVIKNRDVHVLASHPTPPVFDDPVIDQNGRRNHDEIRLWADYVGPINGARYIYDDAGVSGGLGNKRFVIMGDQNADPFDGDSFELAIQQLLDHPRVNSDLAPGSSGGVAASLRQGADNLDHLGTPFTDTADFGETPFGPGNLRADYVLPSRAGLITKCGGVFWPQPNEEAFELVGDFPFPTSDHRLVWQDVIVR